MRIAIAQLNIHIGNFEANYRLMKESVEQAIQSKADLICFSELAVCGYPPLDFLEFKDFIHRSIQVVQRLNKLSSHIAIVVGAPTVNPDLEGKDLFNSAFFLYQQRVQHIAHKALLPNYDIFDEYRYFEPSRHFKTVQFKGHCIALTICEDIWNLGNHNPMYTICPLDEMMHEKVDFILNLSASPFDYEHADARKEVVKANVRRYGVPMFYVNQYGGETDILFDGGSLVFSPDGNCFDELPFFEQALKVYDLEEVIRGGISNEQIAEDDCLIHDALVMGIRDYFSKMGFQRAILGLSGGIDSALTTVLAARALGPENVLVLLMPSQYSSEGSVSDSLALVKTLGIRHEIIPIESVFQVYKHLLDPYFEGKPADVTEENMQARIRGMLLMAFSNKFSYILLNTTNKSEMAVGYGTMYGDLCGGLSVLADVYKTQVYQLARYINRSQEFIPENILVKAPSAELRPNQKDSDSLPDYEVLDRILYQYIEKRKGPKELIALGFAEDLVYRVTRMVNRAEFKRFQAPPVLRVSTKSFGLGRRLPIEAKYLENR